MANQYYDQVNNPMIESSLAIWRNYDGLYRLVGSRCTTCQHNFYPKRDACPLCHQITLESVRFSGNGTIINIEQDKIPQITVVGFRNLLPRNIAIIQLDEGPSIIGEIVDCGHRIPKVGERVHSVLRRLSKSSNQTWKYGIKFLCIEA